MWEEEASGEANALLTLIVNVALYVVWLTCIIVWGRLLYAVPLITLLH